VVHRQGDTMNFIYRVPEDVWDLKVLYLFKYKRKLRYHFLRKCFETLKIEFHTLVGLEIGNICNSTNIQ
jgi:hypothetical protein